MGYKNFAELIARVQGFQQRKRVAVAAAEDEHTLEALCQAREQKIIEPVLIGRGRQISIALGNIGRDMAGAVLHDVPNNSAAALKAVELINAGEADFIMKGKIETTDLLRCVVDKKSCLRTGSIMSHVAFFEIPSYHKLLALSDGGMITYPDLEKKKHILQNAVNTLRGMGYNKPKAAVLCAVEREDPGMPETLDAAALKKMNQEGEISGCIVEGPISYDLAMSKRSARLKEYDSPVTGNVDLFIVPNMATGNILGKALVYAGGAKMAGLIVGARVPIVLTSRGATTEEKYLSLVLCAASVK